MFSWIMFRWCLVSTDDSEKQQVTATAGAPDMLTASKWSRKIRKLIFFVWSQANRHHNFSLAYIPILPITKWEVHEHCAFTLNKDPIIKLRPQPEFSTWLWRSRPTIYKRQMMISEKEEKLVNDQFQMWQQWQCFTTPTATNCLLEKARKSTSYYH